MSSKQTKIRVGVFAVAAVALVVVVLATFTSLHLFRHRDRFDVLFVGSVYGLEEGSLVYFDGIRSGTVDSIEISPEDPTKVRVSILVDPRTPIRADTTAELAMAGITGLKVVDLRGGSPTAPRLAERSTITTKVGTLDKLQASAEKLADQSTALMDKLGKLVDRSTSVATNIDDASSALRGMIVDNKDALHHAIASIDTTVTNVGDQVSKLVASTSTVMTNANEVMTGAHSFVDSANGLVGDVSRVVHSNETQLTGAINDLRQASRSFKDIARELRDKPSRILFSSGGSDRKLP